MKLSQGFNVNELPESTKSEPIPAGTYTVTVKDAEVKDTKAGTGQYISVQYTVIGPNNEGRVIFDNINISNPSMKAQEIGLAQLGSLLRAIGFTGKLTDTDQLIGGNLQVKVKVKAPVMEKDASGNESEKYPASNEISKYEPIEGGQMPKAQPKADNGKPAFLQ